MSKLANFILEKKHFLSTLFSTVWLFFLLTILLTMLISFVSQSILFTDEVYFNALADQMTVEQIENVIKQNHYWSWLIYVSVVFFKILKFFIISSLLSIGCYFVTNYWVFKPFFRIAIQTELVLLLPSITKLFWFTLIRTDYSLDDLQFFYPLSLLNLFDSQSVSPYLLYPLQLANLFELVYWFVLAYGVSQVIKLPMSRAFGLVAASYGSGLLVWVVFVMFLTVSLS